MAAPSAETLQRIASETGLPAPTLEKVLRLLDLLQAIAGDPVLSTRVALKGGTALNVFHLALDRLSVDIDLNYIGALAREAMEADRPAMQAALQALLAARGYQVTRQPEDHAGGKWVARFGSALGGGGAIEVDLNYMSREPLFGVQASTSRPLGGVVATDIPVIDIHEVVAGKLVALMDRRAARDLFDARRILLIPDLDWGLIRAGVLAWGAAGGVTGARPVWPTSAGIRASSARSSPFAYPATISRPPAASRRGSMSRSRSVVKGWLLCSIGPRGKLPFSTSFSTTARSILRVSMRPRPSRRASAECRCWPGSVKTCALTSAGRRRRLDPSFLTAVLLAISCCEIAMTEWTFGPFGVRKRAQRGPAWVGFSAITLAAASAATVFGTPQPLILFNTTPSEPAGLYLASPIPISVGQIVAFRAPSGAFPYADGHLAFLHRVPLLKAVAARGGDAVCTVTGRLTINGRDRGPIASRDSRGVALPRWRGCRALEPGEVFVFSNRVPNSFDSRYFGPVSVHAVIGVYRPLIARIGAS
ncbi:MAG TPA: nucleotidyl transferase AbiEii/AbiGii toxin family protein [Caulobacteraceae bacterium]|jgi:conjugative transfer signal peptidase TraF|nr:nucleotidyl transferase AbiEii/AbiGii toxin family protein [Caulobacteraceae bacterium]